MTPADLAELLKTTAAAVLAEHGLDTAALPATVTVERPRNPEHGDYATNRGAAARQEGRRQPARTGRLARRRADRRRRHRRRRRRRARASSTCASRPSAQGVIVDNVIDAGPAYGSFATRSTAQKINLEFVSANPTGPIHIGGTRWAAVGDALGRLLSTQGAEVVREYYFNDHGAQIDRFARSLIAAAKGEPDPGGRLRGRLHRRHRRPGARQGARRAEPARRRAAGDLPLDRRRPDVHPHQAVAARLRHRLRRLHPRRLDAHQRAGRSGHRQAARDRQHLREGRRNLVAHHRVR